MTNKITRTVAASAVAVSVLAGSLFSATPAQAKPIPLTSAAPADSINGLSRQQVLDRARTWTSERVPYSQTAWKDGYRTDCSGFISMAYNLDQNLVTWLVPLAMKPISKDELRPGDVLLNTKRNRHVVMFGGWLNKAKTKYRVLEQTGQNGVESGVERDMAWPYRIDGELYKPYRFSSMKGYYNAVPPQDRQTVKGFVKVSAPAPKPAVKPVAETTKATAAAGKTAPAKNEPKRDAEAERTAKSSKDSTERDGRDPAVRRMPIEPMTADAGLIEQVVTWVMSR